MEVPLSEAATTEFLYTSQAQVFEYEEKFKVDRNKLELMITGESEGKVSIQFIVQGLHLFAK